MMLHDIANTYSRVLHLFERVALGMAGAILLLMGGIMTASVLGKELFVRPIPDDLLMIGLLNVAIIALPLAYVEYSRGHIAVTITTDWLGVRVLGALRALGALAMGVDEIYVIADVGRAGPGDFSRLGHHIRSPARKVLLERDDADAHRDCARRLL